MELSCPHCGAPARRSRLLSWAFWRAYRCPQCGESSDAVRPFGQQILVLVFFLAVSAGLSAVWKSSLYAPLAAAILAFGLDAVLLFTTTRRLRKVFSRSAAR